MTQKEKAEQLVQKYRVLARFSGGTGDTLPASKECALIVVDEIIKALIYPPNPDEDRQVVHINTLNWWKQVKKEIQKL